MLKIQVLVDNPNSWIMPYAEELVSRLICNGHNASLKIKHDDIARGDILCLLSCEKLFKNLNLNTHNLVVHESDLPKGKGWSPLTWQVIQGKNEIPITLFEATDKEDAGDIYKKIILKLTGFELIDDLRKLQAQASIDLILEFVKLYPKNLRIKQKGTSTYYPRRTSKDSKLDFDKTIKEQFNLLRVVDNERYPAWFEIDGHKYYIKLENEN